MAEQLMLLLRSEEMTLTSQMPAVMCGYSLFADRKDGLVYAQIEFISTSDTRIKKLTADIECRDKNGNVLNGVYDAVYDELYRNRGQKFGEETKIELPDKRTRSIEVTIKQVELVDGSVYSAEKDADYITVPVQRRLVDFFGSERYSEQYRRQTNLSAQFVAEDLGEKWMCSCGAFNSSSEKKCYRCTAGLALLKKLLDKKELDTGLKEYEEEYKEKKSKEKSRKKSRRKSLSVLKHL